MVLCGEGREGEAQEEGRVWCSGQQDKERTFPFWLLPIEDDMDNQHLASIW